MNKSKQSLASLVLLSGAVLALGGCATHRDYAYMGAGPAVVTTTQTTTAPVVVAAAPAAVQLSAADLHFIAVAAGAGMYEVEAARIAAARASDAKVRSYAQMLVDHHTANNGELMALVQAKGQRVAPGLPAPLQQKVTTLSGLSGTALDQEFVRTTGVQDHKAAIAAFEQGRASVTDRDLRAFIDKTLPVLQQHLRQAQDLAGSMAG